MAFSVRKCTVRKHLQLLKTQSDSHAQRRGRVHCGAERPERSERWQDGSGDGDVEWTLPNASTGADWREYRASLVLRSRASAGAKADGAPATPAQAAAADPCQGSSSCWAHMLARPEEGCVLVANPLLFTQHQTYFDKSVILIMEHSTEGSMGFILNKPSELRLEDIRKATLGREFGVFSGNQVFLGGDVDADGLYLLHQHDVEGAFKIRDGLYLGGANALCDLANNNKISSQSVRWFCRYAGWRPDQLEEECKRNVWYPVSCSVDMLLKPLKGDGRELWHHLMELVGDDFKRVSEHIRADADAM